MKDILITYAGYFLALIGFIFGIFQLRLRKRYERESKILDMRYHTYREYLSKLDSINEALRIKYTDDFSKVFSDHVAKILKNPDDESLLMEMNDQVIAMNNKLSEMHNQVMSVMSKTCAELNGLRIVCSKDMLKILDEYQDLAKSQIDDFGKFLGKIDLYKFTPPTIDPALQGKHNRLDQIKRELEFLMRKELGAE